MSRSRRKARRTASMSSTIKGGREAERVGHLGASAASLVEVEQRVLACERRQVGAEPLQVEPGAAVKHQERIRAAPVYPVEETYTTCARYVARVLARLGSKALTADVGLRGRAGGGKQDQKPDRVSQSKQVELNGSLTSGTEPQFRDSTYCDLLLEPTLEMVRTFTGAYAASLAASTFEESRWR